MPRRKFQEMTVPASCVKSRPGCLTHVTDRKTETAGQKGGRAGTGGQVDRQAGGWLSLTADGGQNYLGMFVPPCLHSTMCTVCTALHSCFIICIVLIHITVHVAVHHCTLQLYTVGPNYICRLKLCNLQPILGAATWPWHPLVLQLAVGKWWEGGRAISHNPLTV